MKNTRAPIRCSNLSSSALPNRGFTLVEMIVVIAIIAALAGLTLGVVITVNRKSEARETESTLKLLDAAYLEWKQTSERDISYGVNGEPTAAMQYEIEQDIMPDTPPGTGDDHEATDQLLAIIMRNKQTREILANINPDRLVKHDADEITVRDAWDGEIIVVFPGRKWLRPGEVFGHTETGDPDADGTIRTEFENVFGVCESRRVCFISAGPDGKFGNVHPNTAWTDLTPDQQKDVKAASDNIYSYPILVPR